MQPTNLTSLIKFRFKYSEIDLRNGPKVIRWYSRHLPNNSDRWCFELELGERKGYKKHYPNVRFCWINWDIGGGRKFVHIPNLSQVQTIEGLMELLKVLSAGEYEVEERTEEEVNEYIEKHREVFSKYGLL